MNPINIEDLTLKQVRELQSLTNQQQSQTHPFQIGANYFIRTVTYHYTGRLKAVHQHELVLEDAAWIADDGRFSEALSKCEFAEVEPYPAGEVVIGRGAVLDASIISTIPSSQK